MGVSSELQREQDMAEQSIGERYVLSREQEAVS